MAAAATPRRVRVEPNIYRRADGKLEIGYRDSDGRQRWEKVEGGITAARKRLGSVKGRKADGHRVAPNPRLTFGRRRTAGWRSA